MPKGNKASIILIVLGVLTLILSLGADCLKLGTNPGFGYHQLSGVLIGVIEIGIGLLLKFRKAQA